MALYFLSYVHIIPSAGALGLTLYRPIFQLLEGSNLAFALKEQYINNYKRYHHDRHTIGKVFSFRIRWQKFNAKPFLTPKIHGPEWRKSRSENWNRKSNRFFVCGAAIKFVLSTVDSFDPCRHLLYTFPDVSSYHSNAVSEVAVASHARRSIEREIDK